MNSRKMFGSAVFVVLISFIPLFLAMACPRSSGSTASAKMHMSAPMERMKTQIRNLRSGDILEYEDNHLCVFDHIEGDYIIFVNVFSPERADSLDHAASRTKRIIQYAPDSIEWNNSAFRLMTGREAIEARSQEH